MPGLIMSLYVTFRRQRNLRRKGNNEVTVRETGTEGVTGLNWLKVRSSGRLLRKQR
jgi:hypothetical protein